jgi:taurine--2-oxoglutarate transaminase
MNQLSKEYTFFSWSAQGKVAPIAMEKAKGCYFWDADGKKYFDMNSQLMCTNIGHGHPKIVQAIKDQAEQFCYAGPGFSTKPRAEVGPLLAARTPGDLNKFFFTLGGAEANENAIKFAKFYTKRHKLLARYRSYHGATQGAIALTGDPRRWPNEPSIPGIVRIFDPYKYRSHLYQDGMPDEEFSEKILNQLEETLMYENPESFAAIFLETVTGTNGLIPPPNGYIQGIRKICDKYGILMVCDEVMAGLGRTGEWFAVDHWKVVPDMITMAKGLTSGYLPLGAVAVNGKISKEFDEKVFQGGLTYQSHPMCLATAVAVLKVLEEEKIVENSKNIGKIMKSLMEELKNKHPSVGDVRSIGLFGALELVKNRKTKEPLAPFNGTSEAMTKVGAYLKEKGIYAFVYSNLIHTNPPLIVNENELREAYRIVDQALDIADKYTV